MPRSGRYSSRRSAFTLVELLIVLAIIGLLAAILLPAFKTAQEKSYQAACASNLQQIYQAVQLYRADEKYYPASLGTLLPTDYDLDGGTNGAGTGYFKGGRDALLCSNDDTDAGTTPRSSYGDLSATMIPPASSMDMSRYVWNYWGYRKDSATSCTGTTITNVNECAGTTFRTSMEAWAAADAAAVETPAVNIKTNPDITVPYNEKSNPIKYSLSNRFAPTGTIITHCIYHRLPTAASKIAYPHEIYIDAEGDGVIDGSGARDIVLRLDGSARVLDVSRFPTIGNWRKQNF